MDELIKEIHELNKKLLIIQGNLAELFETVYIFNANLEKFIKILSERKKDGT